MVHIYSVSNVSDIYTLSNVQDICLGNSPDNCANEGCGSITGAHHSCLSVRCEGLNMIKVLVERKGGSW